MNVIRRRGWEIPERHATPEHLFFNRRGFLAGGAVHWRWRRRAARAQRVTDLAHLPDPTADLYPAKRNEKYKLDRPITDEKINDHYNNFYEFNSSKDVAAQAQTLPIAAVDGEDRRHGGKAAGDRHRRTHPQDDAGGAASIATAASKPGAWRSLGPGFPFAKLVDFAKPLGSAKYRARWKPSTIPRWRPACARAGIRGPISRA